MSLPIGPWSIPNPREGAAFPLTLIPSRSAVNEPVDLNASHPSSLADEGSVRWSTASLSPDHRNLAVSFPHIRWAVLRATEGWAALQHHAVLRTTVILHPPRSDFPQQKAIPNVLVELRRGSFFTLVPADIDWKHRHDFVPEWASAVSPTVYHLYVSGDYEVLAYIPPDRSLRSAYIVNICLQSPSINIERETSYDVIPDFVKGFAFGDALGIGFRCRSTSWWTATALSPSPELREAGLVLDLLTNVRFAPAFEGDVLSFDLHVTSGGSSATLSVSVSVTQLAHWSRTGAVAIKASYFTADIAPIGFIVLPPTDPNAPFKAASNPPILALHGAGLDIFKQSLWVEAVPRQQRSWVIFPSGRTPWGLDWHGPSADDAWGTVSALASILEMSSEWKPWAVTPEMVVIIGHSNGGQGTWYHAARHPNRVVASKKIFLLALWHGPNEHVIVIPAAGFIKAQAYVPLTHSRSAHFIDPFLRAILESSFTSDDNDLFLSNLVDTPSLVIHGGSDMNVPTWHSRELVGVLKTWATDAIVSYREEPGQGHWYPSVFRNAQVNAFLDSVLDEERPPARRSATFTLTTALPADAGSLHGWRILSLRVPGRLARLTVKMGDGIVSVITCNVGSFSLDALGLDVRRLDIDGTTLAIPEDLAGGDSTRLHFQRDSGRWRMLTAAETPQAAQRSTNPYSILRSPGRLRIVVSGGLDGAMSVARRLATDLLAYFKLDADIVHETELGDGDTRAGTGQRCRHWQSQWPVHTSMPGEEEDGVHHLGQGKWSARTAAEGRDIEWRIPGYHVHTSTRIFSFRHDAVHNCARPVGLGTSCASLPDPYRIGSG
ncbi:hypothetical protein BC826DRAFT_1104235 [Russula brevipes]|nr:hypothetical protein BC826DRAFT_1104235 [Russula brevipes]